MSKTIKTTLGHLLAWLIVGSAMIIIFFSNDTLNNFTDNKTKTFLLAFLVGFGYLSNAIEYFIQKSKKYGFKKDERDLLVQSKAMNFSLIVIATYVYSLATSIYTKYEIAGFIPIGWLWFLAYSMIVILHISLDVGLLYHYFKQGN
ncbi:MAG: hypothetical protein JXR88_18560 [Clostridia bacterium]|nr:hypothetical protein [Clostridia bacterium]